MEGPAGSRIDCGRYTKPARKACGSPASRRGARAEIRPPAVDHLWITDVDPGREAAPRRPPARGRSPHGARGSSVESSRRRRVRLWNFPAPVRKTLWKSTGKDPRPGVENRVENRPRRCGKAVDLAAESGGKRRLARAEGPSGAACTGSAPRRPEACGRAVEARWNPSTTAVEELWKRARPTDAGLWKTRGKDATGMWIPCGRPVERSSLRVPHVESPEPAMADGIRACGKAVDVGGRAVERQEVAPVSPVPSSPSSEPSRSSGTASPPRMTNIRWNFRTFPASSKSVRPAAPWNGFIVFM